MKKIIILCLMSLGMTFGAFAQPKPEGAPAPKPHPTPEQIMERQALNMANSLALSDEQTAALKPIYIEYRKALMELKKALPKVKPTSTDAEVEARLKAGFDYARKAADLKESYYDKFRTVLTVKQVDKLYRLDRMVGHHHKKHHGQNRPPFKGMAKPMAK